MEWLDAKVRVHPLIMVEYYLNPLFCEFQFLEDPNKRRLFREGAQGITRSLIVQAHETEGANSVESASQGVDNCRKVAFWTIPVGLP